MERLRCKMGGGGGGVSCWIWGRRGGGKMENQDGVSGAYGIKMKDLLIEIDAAYVAMLLRIVLD